MADINSLYGGGGQTLNTNGGLAGLGGGGTDADFFKAMAMRKMQQAEEDRQRRQEREDYAFAQARQAANQAAAPPDVSAQDQRIKDMQERDMRIQMQALQGKAPTRRITGTNIIAGDVLDPLAMNAYQRKAFLPEKSEMQGNINAPSALTQDKESKPGSTMQTPVQREDERKAGLAQGQGEHGGSGGSGRADWYGLQTSRPRPKDDEEE